MAEDLAAAGRRTYGAVQMQPTRYARRRHAAPRPPRKRNVILTSLSDTSSDKVIKIRRLTMNGQLRLAKVEDAASVADEQGANLRLEPRSITDIIADLSKPVAERHLKT